SGPKRPHLSRVIESYARHNRPGWPPKRVIVNQQAALADKVRTKVGDDEIVCLFLTGRLHRTNTCRSADRVQLGAITQFFGHPPTDTCYPERMAASHAKRFAGDG